MSWILALSLLICVIGQSGSATVIPCLEGEDANMSSPLPAALSKADLAQLEELQEKALRYFIENQLPNGLILDRQHNHGPIKMHGLCSTSGTGMGLIAIALASSPEYKIISRREAIRRVRLCLRTALNELPHDHGIMPHFVDSKTLAPVGVDRLSTIDSAWLVAGALWSAEFLQDVELQMLAARLYRRVDWHYWAGSPVAGELAFIHHGADVDGALLKSRWDRFNAETVFMYVLAIGAPKSRALPPETWSSLSAEHGTVAGHRFVSADLGLFAFQYSLSLLDFRDTRWLGQVDLFAQCKRAAQANYDFCSASAGKFRTYKRFWGITAGDGPGKRRGKDAYRAYAPQGPVDGTAHITGTLASIELCPELVAENLRILSSARGKRINGRYGLSNINIDRRWVGRDVVAIDLGAQVMAVDNLLHDGRVRSTFQGLRCVQQARKRMGSAAEQKAAAGG